MRLKCSRGGERDAVIGRRGARIFPNFSTLSRQLVCDLFAANFGLEELKQVRYPATFEEVGDEEFMEAWRERFEATRQKVSAALRARCEERKRRLEADGRDDSGGE